MTSPYEDMVLKMIEERKAMLNSEKSDQKKAELIKKEIELLEKELATYQGAMELFRLKKKA